MAAGLSSQPKTTQQALAVDPSHAERLSRQAYWDSVFVQADPWNYGSDYERVKYERTLSLVPSGVRQACELACAEGHFTERLARVVGHLIATDISAKALERARARCAELSNVQVAQLDLVTDPLPDQVDLIVCSEVLYYLNDLGELARVCSRLRDALAEGGWLISAHAFVLSDDLSRTGFDWDSHYGAAAIADIMATTPGLLLEASLQTELYRVDLYRRISACTPLIAPRIEHLPLGATLEPDVARQVVWGGAEIRRSEAYRRESTDCLPILMYHRVTEDGPPEVARYRTHPEAFKAQMQWLRSHGYYAVSSTEAVQRITSRGEFPGRPVLIIFNEGTKDFYETAWPILRDCNFTAEVFIVVGLVGGRAVREGAPDLAASLMNEEQIVALARDGVRFGIGLAAPHNGEALSNEKLISELTRSRSMLEALTGAAADAFATPCDALDERFFFLAKQRGFEFGLASHEGFARLGDDPLRLRRINVWGNWSLEQFAEAVRGRPNPCNDLVSVVIPAWNAEDTIDETLRSVRAQTHKNIEIVVVDDGSVDRTPEIIKKHMHVDRRVRLIQQSNSGVAAARNKGAHDARGQILAFLDADDLWSPDKIRRQLVALWAGGPRTGLVYCWYALIDSGGRVIDTSYRPTESGDVLERICRGNLIGNGSSALLTREAFDAVGGFDLTLRALGAQGCEDWQFYFKIAERYRCALVPEVLTGYRQTPGAMSNNLPRMLRSSDHLARFMRSRQPALSRSIEAGSAYHAMSLLAAALARGHVLGAAQSLVVLLFRSPRRAARAVLGICRAIVEGRLQSTISERDRSNLLRFKIGESEV